MNLANGKGDRVMAEREMSAAEKRDGEWLIKDIEYVIEGIDPALASWALVSVLGSLIASYAASPLKQARHLGQRLVDTVKSPPLLRSVN